LAAIVFAKHLPPSAGLPQVLALSPAALGHLEGLAELTLAEGEVDALPSGPFDAVVGLAPPKAVPVLAERLRPGGRLILAAEGLPGDLLASLTAAGLIHCLVEPQGALTLYRGERAPAGSPIERHAELAGTGATLGSLLLINPSDLLPRYVYLLVTQTPNKPAWKLAPSDHLEWHAATLLHPITGERALLAFSGLVKAVAFMQSAILAGTIKSVNKVGKFPAEAAQGWDLPVCLNPEFESVRGLTPGPALMVDPAAAITGEE
jgi:hypothetical protein